MKNFLVTFELKPHTGGGVATYSSEFVEAYAKTIQKLSTFHISPQYTEKKISSIFNQKLIQLPPYEKSASKNIGHFLDQSIYLAKEILLEIKKNGPPLFIEFPDAFALSYSLIKLKKEGVKELQNINISICTHTPIFLFNKWNHKKLNKFPDSYLEEIEKYCLENCDSITHPSQALLKKLQKEEFLELKNTQHILYPLKKSTPEIKKHDFYNKNSTFLYVASRLEYWKGIEELVKSYIELDSPYLLKIYGSDTFFEKEKSSFIKYIKKNYPINPSRIIFPGLKNQEFIKEQSHDAICKIHPSLFDNFPYSVLESMERGEIVLSSKFGGISEIIINEKNGLLYSPLEKNALKKALISIQNLSQEERFNLAKNAQRTIHTLLNPEKIISEKIKFLTLYQKKQPPTNQLTHQSATLSNQENLQSDIITFCHSDSVQVSSIYLEKVKHLFNNFSELCIVSSWYIDKNKKKTPFFHETKTMENSSSDPLTHLSCKRSDFIKIASLLPEKPSIINLYKLLSKEYRKDSHMIEEFIVNTQQLPPPFSSTFKDNSLIKMQHPSSGPKGFLNFFKRIPYLYHRFISHRKRESLSIKNVFKYIKKNL